MLISQFVFVISHTYVHGEWWAFYFDMDPISDVYTLEMIPASEQESSQTLQQMICHYIPFLIVFFPS